MNDFATDPAAAPLGFVVNPQTGHGAATGGNNPPRPTASTITDAQLDALYDTCGRIEIANRALNTAAQEALERAEQAETERDGAYRERAQLLALLASLHPSVIAPAPDVAEPGWQILYLRIGGRQASWHIAPRDADLFVHVEHVPADDRRAQWDGHTTEAKYAHIGQHAARLYVEARGRIETPLTPEIASSQVVPVEGNPAAAADVIPEICPHCDQPQPRGNIDEHIATAHADIPPCTATLDNQHTNGTRHCVLRAWHRKGHGEYGEWHVSARGPLGRTIWNDTADGATPHSPLDQPKEQPRV